MKVTSEQLLDLFGLKFGDKIEVDNETHLVICEFEQYLIQNKETKNTRQISWLCDLDYEIIKPKPTLTDDEKS